MTREQLIHVLLVFDHKSGHLIESGQFENGEEAVDAYSLKEKQYVGHDEIEIVLVASDSLATIERTHANYFDGTIATSGYLAGVE
jgi:hypothetical protein